MWENYAGLKILLKALSERSRQIILQSAAENRQLEVISGRKRELVLISIVFWQILRRKKNGRPTL